MTAGSAYQTWRLTRSNILSADTTRVFSLGAGAGYVHCLYENFKSRHAGHYEQCNFYGNASAKQQGKITRTTNPVMAARRVGGVQGLSRDRPPRTLQSGVVCDSGDCGGMAAGTFKGAGGGRQRCLSRPGWAQGSQVVTPGSVSCGCCDGRQFEGKLYELALIWSSGLAAGILPPRARQHRTQPASSSQ
jgi:hypothetical protein